MCRTQCMSALLVLCVGLAQSFSWDVAVTRADRLEFYNDGILTYWTIPTSNSIEWMTYDPVLNRLLFTDLDSYEHPIIYSFDIATTKIQPLIEKKTDSEAFDFAYNPTTELLYMIANDTINSISLQLGSDADEAVELNFENDIPFEIAVDSCGGYIYWITSFEHGKSEELGSNTIERARFYSTDKEIVIDRSYNKIKISLTIDQQTQKIYWIETRRLYTGVQKFTIESADLNGKNKRTLYSGSGGRPEKLTVSKDYIIYGGRFYGSLAGLTVPENYTTYYWQIPKNPSRDTNVKHNKVLLTSFRYERSSYAYGFRHIAANYQIEEQTQGIDNCNALKDLVPKVSKTNNSVNKLCAHGTKVSRESRCECTQSYTGERCDITVCQNYCLQGDCSDSAEGKPKCRCNPGYSGERCEINACHEYCLNNGVCSLNNNNEPVCQCTGNYEGERCNVPAFLMKCVKTVSMFKDFLKSDVTSLTPAEGVESRCAYADV